jgi:hypothetical protein
VVTGLPLQIASDPDIGLRPPGWLWRLFQEIQLPENVNEGQAGYLSGIVVRDHGGNGGKICPPITFPLSVGVWELFVGYDLLEKKTPSGNGRCFEIIFSVERLPST